jgi:hypothetical protein
MEKNKGQKLIAAIYLATGHLSDNDPLKQELRLRSMELLKPVEHKEAVKAIDTLLGAAVITKTISEKNASIISFEMHRFSNQSGSDTEETITELFVQPIAQKTFRPLTQTTYKSVQAPPVKDSESKLINNEKNNRHDAILSFINTRKSAAIKDIAALFPELSEKTIQRELGTLVSSGKITKRGSKRWSIYMAVGA